jgi:hypothetical protein
MRGHWEKQDQDPHLSKGFLNESSLKDLGLDLDLPHGTPWPPMLRAFAFAIVPN